jgi:hypothetical protein
LENDQAARQPTRESGDVDEGITFAPDQVAQGGGEIVLNMLRSSIQCSVISDQFSEY